MFQKSVAIIKVAHPSRAVKRIPPFLSPFNSNRCPQLISTALPHLEHQTRHRNELVLESQKNTLCDSKITSSVELNDLNARVTLQEYIDEDDEHDFSEDDYSPKSLLNEKCMTETSQDHNPHIMTSELLSSSEQLGKRIPQSDVVKVRRCISFWKDQIEKNIGNPYENAEKAERLLFLLLPGIGETWNDPHDINVKTSDFNKVLTCWRFATLQLVRRGEGQMDNQIYKTNLKKARELACACLYASEKVQHLLTTMDRLWRGGCVFCRPNPYSYESTIANWSTASKAFNTLLRSEAKSRSKKDDIPARFGFLQGSRWHDPSILDKYQPTDPAKNADELLQEMITLEDINPEFRVSTWAYASVISAWKQINIKPRRIHADLREKVEDDESYYAERAEQILWKMVEIAKRDMNTPNLDKHRFTFPSMTTFRDVITAWSHSHHPEGMIKAENILTKMGNLFHEGCLESLPRRDIYSAVIGAWARRAPLMPIDAPRRATQILKHLEYQAGTEAGKAEINRNQNVSHISPPNRKGYYAVFGAWRSSLYALKLSNDAYSAATEVDNLLRDTVARYASGHEDAKPVFEYYSVVVSYYINAASLLSAELEKEFKLRSSFSSPKELAYIGKLLTKDESKLKRNEKWHLAKYKRYQNVQKNARRVPQSGTEIECSLIETDKQKQLIFCQDRIVELLSIMEKGYFAGDQSMDLDIDTYIDVIAAFSKADTVADSAYRASELLERVIRFHKEGVQNMTLQSSMFAPVIYALLNTNDTGSILQASKLLKIQETLYMAGNPDLQPDSMIYRSLLMACADNAVEVRSLLDRMSKLYETNIVDDLESPTGTTIFGFHEIIDSWLQIGEAKEAAEWAESMLDRVSEDLNESSDEIDETVLNTKNFNSAINAWLKTGIEGIHRAERVLKKMERLYKKHKLKAVQPDHLSYHLLIRGIHHSNRKLNNSQRIGKVLNRMIASDVKPTTLTFKLILERWGRLTKNMDFRRYPIDRAERVLEAEKVLERMEQMYTSGQINDSPTTKLFNIVLSCWCTSNIQKKGLRARKLLELMKQFHVAGNPYTEPDFHSYSLVINSCLTGPFHSLSVGERRNTFQAVMKTFQEMSLSENIQPNSITYRNVLKACKLLLPDGAEQQHHTNAVFQHCCRIGVVDDVVLDGFRFAADPKLFEEVAGSSESRDIPFQWRKNVFVNNLLN